MFVADTNVLVYAANEDAPEHARCRSLVESWRRGNTPWYLTWGICYEFLRVVTHPRVLEAPLGLEEARGFVTGLLASPALSILVHTDRHPDVLEETATEAPWAAGNVMHDMHTAVLMREHGVRRIWTRDADFHRFDFLEVLDPMA